MMRPLTNPQITRHEPVALLSQASFRQPDYLVDSAWLEHGPFLSWLIETQAPRLFVELGCHHGYSYFAACQAVKRLGLQTGCFAVDTWRGDEHAGYYGEEVFGAVNAHNAKHYGSFSQLLRVTFKDAASLFADGSVDLLHIDGRHFHEDVVEDLAVWRSKLSADAIVLFHDTNVRERGFGVWKLFEELRQRHATFEFLHGHGLGVVAFGLVPPRLQSLFNASAEERALLRTAYATLGRAVADRFLVAALGARSAQSRAAHDAEMEALSLAHASRVAEMEAALAGAKARIDDLEARLAELRVAHGRAEAQLWVQHATIRRLEDAEVNAKAEREATERRMSLVQAENARLSGSMSWRVTAPLRRLYARHPHKMRVAISLARVGWWLVNFRFRLIADRVAARARLRRDEATLAADPMFDVAYYRQIVPDLDAAGLSPARHYLLIGRFQNLSPHPLFDGRWYMGEYGLLDAEDPLTHYIRRGRAEGRKPNAFFDPDWYRSRYPEVERAGLDPLHHFMQEGAAKRFDPSPRFNTAFYLDEHPDVTTAGLNPLAHYLHYGMREGRQFKGYDIDLAKATPVTDVPIECRKQPSLHPETALFVTHSANGRLKPHVRHYLEALAREGVAIILIVAADRGFTEDEPWLRGLVDGLYVRGNRGWDFAAWAHVLRLNPWLYRADILYWLNDSVLGPVNRKDFHALMQGVRRNAAGLVGLTANFERGRHLQSYFLALKQPALKSFVFQEFVLAIGCFPDKDDAINAYEIRLSPTLAAAGVAISAIFEPPSQYNPTIYHWKALLGRGFPFLKILAITNDIKHVDKSDWRETLQAHGYDVLLADRLLAERLNPPMDQAGPVDWRPAVEPPGNPPKVVFIGPFNYGNGLGVASRGYLSAMMHAGCPLNAMPIARPFHIHRRVAPSIKSTEFVGAADVAIVHVNPESWNPLLDSSLLHAIGAARYRVGAFVCESREAHLGFSNEIPALDAVWVPSLYCAAGFERLGYPVHVVPYPVTVRPPVIDGARTARMRARMGLTEENRLILYSFDASSYLSRKNPMALLRAFDRTCLAGQGWRLILKTKNLAAAEAEGVALSAAVAHSSGALLVDRPLDADDARALLDLADIYVSPHAAEGFGLTIAEAMAQGKPVIATDYSGSTDFLDESCGFPVRWTPWLLEDDVGPYQKGTQWALVDEDALSETLLEVSALDPATRADIGARARSRILTELSHAAVALRMRAAIDSILCR